jgi:hypothetical protein
MNASVDIFQNHNFILTDLRVSPSLPSAVSGVFVDWETIGILADSKGNGVEVFSNDTDSNDQYDIGFHVRRSAGASC